MMASPALTALTRVGRPPVAVRSRDMELVREASQELPAGGSIETLFAITLRIARRRWAVTDADEYGLAWACQRHWVHTLGGEIPSVSA